MEPRARASSHKKTLNFPEELRLLLHGSGAPAHPDHLHPLPDGSSKIYLERLFTENRTHPPTPFTTHDKSSASTRPEPFPETLRVLDEIVTDYIIETSHAALQLASYAGRAKLKREDFEHVMRRDRPKLGRVQELFKRQKDMKIARKTAGAVGESGGVEAASAAMKFGIADLQGFADFVGEEGTGRGKGKGKGRRRKRNADEMDGEGDVDGLPTMAGVNGGGLSEDIGDIDVDIDNDLEAAEVEVDKHRNKKARSELD